MRTRYAVTAMKQRAALYRHIRRGVARCIERRSAATRVRLSGAPARRRCPATPHSQQTEKRHDAS